MRTLPLLAACCAVSGATAAAVLLLSDPAPTPPPAVAPDPAIASALADLRREQAQLQEEVAALRAAPAQPAEVSRGPALEDLVRQAVAIYMEEQAAESGAVEAVAAAFSPEDSLGRLLDPRLGHEERDAIWKAAQEAGEFEQLIAELQARAAAEPRNAQLQFELGYGYLQPIMNGTAPGPKAGEWATKADGAFDAALAIDPANWDARFSKAVSYTFWPPIFGKQKAAIAQFETLVQQQGRMAPRPGFAQTYLFLGNLYEQTGQGDKAKETWNLGLAAFPNDPDLRKRLGLQD